jgi:hypothetical protein
MNYTITKILTSETIGDSLFAINQNYQNLDEWLTSIQLSAQNFWIPLRDYYRTVSEALKEKTTLAEQLSSSWNSLTTTIETNSAKWLEPLIVFYPNIESSAVIDKNKISTWLNNNYIVYNSTVANSIPTYIENQKAYVYIMKKEASVPVNSVPLLSNSLNCTVNNVTVCTSCVTTYTGNVQCTNGDFNCAGNTSSCTECGTALCYYDQTGTPNYSPVIQAYLNINFNEVHEDSNITCLKYEVKDCEWRFVSQL